MALIESEIQVHIKILRAENFSTAIYTDRFVVHRIYGLDREISGITLVGVGNMDIVLIADFAER